MKNVKYTDCAEFRCLEHLRETCMDLYLIHCGLEHCLPTHAISHSIREEYIVHFVLEGKGSYTVNGITYFLNANQMFLIRPGEEVSYAADMEEPWTYAWIGFNGIRAEACLKNSGFSKQAYVLPFRNQDLLVEQIIQILNAVQLSFSNDLKRNACLMMILSLLVDNYTHDFCNKNSTSGHYNYNRNVYVEQAMDYVKWRYSYGINVSDIANYIGISRTYLNHVFQKELGLSAQKFLMDFRLHKAANLLISTEYPVAEVSTSVGYEDSLAFSKAFKKKFGLSPKNYRLQKEDLEKYSEKQPAIE